ncbi:hypothetical protein A2926_01490 [Candidatus Giovannonibacteria bacterium RIFCSPLOWO2_01_FULL_44_40]|uniref:Transcriptional repressor PaaX-like central Cas2-like domain-containing protein n=1 Tax=Candidatus Giovannonibacteria bacterium RIFCSPHIGHO2_01_FULL_45_23 TaxID=1798325 RepID=A0A1F5VEY8_9BACT|nr:MAG: hypothetical protein A2834_01680 [Candidatus Giovannonibacteria bacterium RIFCSPHIGHO2_01_FULL_45_23]OGF75337.1 MAG: hypothetical protein A3C77_00360 [Candidatus Giovannonibacteria bacterium RIFCSPHIGHO2_02_FULL_45_13]OGF79668.1 MAG: hypothetical protein A2926_01490 [Candidatus Giovannonibacteria bacterium RIFCSPLOWO2_01_FULL_44_40]
MVKKANQRLKGLILKQVKPSASELILIALKKMANAPFDVLLKYSEIRNQLNQSSARTAIHRLKKRALIYGECRGAKLVFMLTEDGEREVEKVKSRFEKTKPKQWDGKWRIIIFDIPEKLRGKRDLLRRELVGFGFKQLQESVWAYPYPLPQEFRDLWQATGIFKYCVIFEVDEDKIENAGMLK